MLRHRAPQGIDCSIVGNAKVSQMRALCDASKSLKVRKVCQKCQDAPYRSEFPKVGMRHTADSLHSRHISVCCSQKWEW